MFSYTEVNHSVQNSKKFSVQNYKKAKSPIHQMLSLCKQQYCSQLVFTPGLLF